MGLEREPFFSTRFERGKRLEKKVQGERLSRFAWSESNLGPPPPTPLECASAITAVPTNANAMIDRFVTICRRAKAKHIDHERRVLKAYQDLEGKVLGGICIHKLKRPNG